MSWSLVITEQPNWNLAFVEPTSSISRDGIGSRSTTLAEVGVPGPPGPPGPAGSGSGTYVVHTQTSPAATWPITHNLGRYPSVSVVVGGELVDADIEYSDLNVVAVVFASPVAGAAVLI